MVLDREERPRGGGKGRSALTLSWRRGDGRRLREAGGVGGQSVERVGWRSGQGRRAAASRAGRVWAWGGRGGRWLTASAEGARAGGRGSDAGAGHWRAARKAARA
jgi:hypothetical protein